MRRTRFNRATFLGEPVENWINLGISIIMVFAGGLLLSRVVFALLMRLVSTTASIQDDAILQAIRPQVIWFFWVFSAQFATSRLTFLSAETKQIFSQIYFVMYVLLIFRACWVLIDMGVEWYQQKRAAEAGHPLESAVILVTRALRFLLFAVGLIAVLSNFGIDVGGLLTALGIVGLALSLAAQDTLNNMISGMIILTDQPFRVKDRIEIEGLGTWGDVVEIGVRSTRIRTRDNRLVIVPNSKISTNQIVNYTYPDPRYREQVQIGVAYGSNLQEVRRLVSEAVRTVEGVIDELPVDVLFMEFGDSAIILRVRWWIHSYEDTRRMFDKINEAIYLTLTQAGIEMPGQQLEVILRSTPGEQDNKGESE